MHQRYTERQREGGKRHVLMAHGHATIPPSPFLYPFGIFATHAHVPTMFSSHWVQDLNLKVSHVEFDSLNH